MAVVATSANALQTTLDASSQPTSKASSPASPTSSFQTQQPLPPRSFLRNPIRGQNSPFPSTPTSERSNNVIFESPPGISYADFVRTWTDNHVARWLSDIKCGNHASTFKANDIRGDILLELDQFTLKEMGIASIGDRLRMINAVRVLRQKCATRSTIPAPFEAVRPSPRVYINGEYGDGGSSTSSGESSHGRSDSLTEISPSSRLAHRLQNKPPPLHLGSNNRNDLPRIVRDGFDSARSGAQSRSLPQSTPVNGTISATSRQNLPPLPPAPRSQPPLPPGPPGGRPNPGRLQPGTSQSQRARTPTQAELPSYTSTPLPPAPYGQNMLTPTTANSLGSSLGSSLGNNWSTSGSGYGLPSDPRPGNIGGKTLNNRNASRSPNGAHNRNLSFAGVHSPMATTHTTKARPSTGEKNSSHPYASETARSQALQATTAQQLQASLSPIAESFVSGGGTPSPPTAFAVGRGPFNPLTPSHVMAPSLDDLRRKLVKFMLPEEGHSCTINAEDCAGGIEVLEKVLKKFNKLGSRGESSDIMDLVETEDGGLSVDGWGVYLDWGQGDGQGKPLTEGELLSICHASPDNPARERGLTLRRTGRGKRSKPAPQFFGEGPPLRSHSPTSPLPLPTGELDRDGNLLSPRHAMSFENAQTPVNTKRASSISILSGLGVPHPEKTLDPPASPTVSVDRKSPSGSPSKKPSKLRNFFGQRPPSELITTHLAEYFPFTEKKVLARTARNSMMRASTIGSLGKRDSTMSWNPAPPLPSRFSSSTAGDRSSIISSHPPVQDKTSTFTGETTPVTDEPPRMSLSTDDGRSIDLDGDGTDESSRVNPTPQLLPPVNISAESFSESMGNLTGGRQRPRPISKAMSIGSKRMSFMTELRSKRDVSDTASLMTVDQITASVESRRESLAVDASVDSTDDWTKVGSDEGGIIDESPELSDGSYEDDSAEDEDLDEEETNVDDDDDDEPGKAVTSQGGTKWIKGALIGAGSFGKVYLGMDASNGLLMAVKQVELPTGSAPNEERKKSMLSALEREIDLLKDLQHENIVQYLYSSLDDDYLNIFLEYVPGGSVTALLRNYGAFEEPLVKNFVRQILQGLNYLHERDIIHRDIKGANILVDNKGGIKISDFGISKKVEDNLLGKRVNRPSLQGSVFWMAPEVVKQTSHTRKADIWSVGCLVVEMLTGEHPWAQLTQMQAIFKIGSSAKPTIPSDISADAQDFLLKTFDLDYEARPGAGELLQHAWVATKKVQSPNKGNTFKAPPTIEITA